MQADIKTISACGCYAASAITAVTAQNTLGVVAVEEVSPLLIEQQIEAVLSDIGADAVKIGMLHSAVAVRAVAKVLKKYQMTNIVLDPVMVSTSGHRLMEDSAVAVLEKELIPLARVITPNIPEAEILLGHSIPAQDALPDAARALAGKYGVSVLLKAGHLTDDVLEDIFYNHETGDVLPLTSHRVDTQNTHGTGCTLSSAFASQLANGYRLNEAANRAKRYINAAIVAGADFQIGHGHGPVCHFYEMLES